MEIWKPIPGYEPYEASSYGRIRSLNKSVKAGLRYNTEVIRQGKVLKLVAKKDGYLHITLSQANKQTYSNVHRLVAKAHLPNPDNLPQVNHKNGNKADNRVDNLEWVTASDNHLHRFAVLGNRPALSKRIKCVETGQEFISSYQAAEWVNNDKYRNSKQIAAMSRKIRACATGKQHTAYGYHWKDCKEPSSTSPIGRTLK